MSKFALLSTKFCHSEPTIGNSPHSNKNASFILQNDLLMDDHRFNVLKQRNTINDENLEAVDSSTLIGDSINDEMFPSPLTSTFRRSQRDCANEENQAAFEVLNQIFF